MIPKSEIDFIYTRFYNQVSLGVGTLAAAITAYATAILTQASAGLCIEWDKSYIVRPISLTASFIAGTITGHLLTTRAIGLIAESSFAKSAISLILNSFASLTGLSYYHTKYSSSQS